jgi:hypothetical protein
MSWLSQLSTALGDSLLTSEGSQVRTLLRPPDGFHVSGWPVFTFGSRGAAKLSRLAAFALGRLHRTFVPYAGFSMFHWRVSVVDPGLVADRGERDAPRPHSTPVGRCACRMAGVPEPHRHLHAHEFQISSSSGDFQPARWPVVPAPAGTGGHHAGRIRQHRLPEVPSLGVLNAI